MHTETWNMAKAYQETLTSVFPGLFDASNGDTADELRYSQLADMAFELDKEFARLKYHDRKTPRLLFWERSKIKKEWKKLSGRGQQLSSALFELRKIIENSPLAPVEWRILAATNRVCTEESPLLPAEGNYLLLTTKKAVALRPFDKTQNVWETSELRTWLNGEFYESLTDAQKYMLITTRRWDYSSDWISKSNHAPRNYGAFDYFPSNYIFDKVSLLNQEEITNLLQDSMDRMLKYRHETYAWWTLRPYRTYTAGPVSNPGAHCNLWENKRMVCCKESTTGSPFNSEYVQNACAVRPILVIDLNKII